MTETPPVITIGVPTYNRAWCLLRFLQAVEKLDYPKNGIRVVFVDNFSEDGTPKMLDEFKERLEHDYESVMMVSEKSNIPEARNTCVKNAIGEYLLFLDTDVIPPPETVKRMLEVLSSNPKAGIVGFPYRCNPPTLAEKMYLGKQPRTVHIAAVIGMGCTMIKQEIFDKIGVFDPKYVADEDADLTIRAKEAGYLALLDPTIVPVHLTRERLFGTLREVFGYCSYSFGPLAKYHFMILQRRRPKWMMNRVLFYLSLAVAAPVAIVGVVILNAWLVLPFVLLYGFIFVYHFERARERWRIINALLFPLFGVAFAVGILREFLISRLV